jgi:hypothetical protein
MGRTRSKVRVLFTPHITSALKLGLPEIILAAPVLLFYGVVMARVT